MDSIQKALSGINAEIFVVDNASRDGSVAMVKENFPHVKLIENRSNAGFAKANNQAIKLARSKYLVLINPDTLVQEDTFVLLLDFFKNYPDAGMVGCKILNSDGSLQLACRRSIPTPWIAFTKLVGLSRLFPKSHLFGKYNLTYQNPDQVSIVDAISGSFMMVRSDVVKQTGMLDEQFFMYGEDLDWCFRIRQAGWKIYYVPDTKIVHYKGASTQKAHLDTLLVFYRAMLQFVRKHFRSKYLFFPQWFLIFGIGIRAGISFLFNLFSKLKWPLVDLVFLNVSLTLALLLRFGSLDNLPNYLFVTIIYSTVWLSSFFFFELYEQRKFSVSRAAAGVLMGLTINSTITYFAKDFAFSRLVVLYSSGFNFILIIGWRLLLKRLAEHSKWGPFEKLKKSYFRKEAIVVGDSESAMNLIQKLGQYYLHDTEVVAALLTDPLPESKNGFAGIPVLNELDNLAWYIEDLNVNEVIFSSDSIPYERMLGLMSESQKLGIDFKIASKKMEVIIGSRTVDYLGDISLVDIDYKFVHTPYRFLKRIMDLTVSLLFTSWLIPVWLGMLIRGYRLKILPVFLLSDQQLNPEKPPQSKLQAPSGETGKKVVVFSKNEKPPKSFWEKSPLFLSIIKGDFSLVGSEVRFHQNSINSPVFRFYLKPGLISFSQVWKEMAITNEERRKQEIYYLKNYTPLFDLQILFKAITKR